MKKFSKLVALALACVMALTMLTACGGGGNTVKKEDQILGVLNEVRKEHSLGEVKMTSELSQLAETMWKNSNDQTWHRVTIDGETYLVYRVFGQNNPAGLTELIKFKEFFEKGVQRYQNGENRYATSFFGRSDLKYVGIYDKIENGKEYYGVVAAFPEKVSPWTK